MTEQLGAADSAATDRRHRGRPSRALCRREPAAAARHLLTIDVFNRFPTPFGLVRDGVAPDHQSIKAVARIFDRVLADPRVRYFGNVTYGVDIHHRELKQLYHQIVYAVGAQADRRMSIPGEDLPNSLPARSFVGWYNGHPDYRDLPADLSCERAVVVGNGNVAMDVTRVLVTSPEALAGTDLADHALEKLRHSKIREVVVLGRRGPAQASFTTPEIRELGTARRGGRDRRSSGPPARRGQPGRAGGGPHRQGEPEDSARLCRRAPTRPPLAASSCASSPRRWRSSAQTGGSRP